MDEKPALTPWQVAVPVSQELWELYRRKAEPSNVSAALLVEEAMRTFARQRGWLPGLSSAGGERGSVAAQVLETANRLEQQVAQGAPPAEGRLYLIAESGAVGQVQKDRFVIGRGKHCDLTIDDSRISREHAAIVRSGSEFWIEDLGSSNGTWFDRQRIERRRIADGDEYMICSEKIRCILR